MRAHDCIVHSLKCVSVSLYPPSHLGRLPVYIPFFTFWKRILNNCFSLHIHRLVSLSCVTSPCDVPHLSLCEPPRPLTRLDLSFIERSHIEEQTVKLSLPPISSFSSRDGRVISSSFIYTPSTAHSVTAAPNNYVGTGISAEHKESLEALA